MKKVFAVLAIMGVFAFSMTSTVLAQEGEITEETVVQEEAAPAPAPGISQTAAPMAPVVAGEAVVEEEVGSFKAIKIKFIEGGAGFMAFVAICLIIGLALCIERIIYLNLATTNTTKLLAKVEEALKNGGLEAAKEVCRNTRGPVASIFYQGLSRMDEGIDVVEKSVVSYGGVQMSQLESGLSWIQLFISIAPMLGFMGTVIGMISAFDAIEAAGDISPNVVAGGMKIALITTVGGLIVAIILQLFYNYIVSKIDSIVLQMEDSSISFIDLLVHYNKK